MASQTFEIQANADDGFTAAQEDGVYPPSYVGEGMLSTEVQITKSNTGTIYTIRAGLLRFDTSALPDNATITAARLRVQVTGLSLSADGKLIAADYFDWTDGSIGDYSA